jgi:hypothetical protein
MRSMIAVILIGVSALAAPAFSQQRAFDPSSVYKRESCQGITILINPEVLKHQPEAAEMRNELTSQLTAMARVMPERPRSALQNVCIWVEWEKKPNGAAEFHPSADWLRQHGYNPEKAGHVELSNARNFVQWSRKCQPWMLLHEFAHAYHFLVLGDHHEGIEAAYKHAVDQELYESVAFCDGSKQRAYALTNAKEYFAELSEAYFGKNDFYPFTRDDLKKHDPVGFHLMEQTWGELRNGAAAPTKIKVVSAGEHSLEISSPVYAHAVHVEDHGQEVLADNWFDLLPGMPVRVRLAPAVKADSVHLEAVMPR